jgi:hypothetical protein
MTSIAPIVTAKVITAQNPQLLSGKGYVEKALGDDKFLITLASGKITIRCTSGTLSEGDAVFIKVQGKDLVITKIPEPVSSPDVQDALDLKGYDVTNRAHTVELKSPALTGSAASGGGLSLSLQGKKMPPEGFYHFDTIEKALTWLSRVSDGLNKKDEQAILEKFSQGPIVLQIIETSNEGTKAFFLPIQAAEARLSYFAQQHLRSNLWNVFFPDGLMPLLQNRKNLPFVRIMALDTLLPENLDFNDSTPDAENKPSTGVFSSMGKTGAGQLFTQWLTIATDEAVPLSLLSFNQTFPASAQLPPLVETIQRAQRPESTVPSLPIGLQDFSINQSAMAGSQEKETFLPKLLERLGINYENALLHLNESNDETKEPVPSLKQLLLKLDNDLNAALPPQERQTNKEPLLELYNAGRAFSATWLKASRQVLSELFPSIGTQSYPKETGSLTALQDSGGTAIKNLLNQFQEWSKKITALSDNTVATIAKQAETIHIVAKQFDHSEGQGLFASSRTTVDISKAAADFDKLTESIAFAVKTSFEKLSGMVKEAQGFISNQPQMHSEIREIALQASRHIRFISGLVDQCLQESSKLLDRLDGKAFSPSMETTRRLVESALDRIDSMQISAKPTITADARQQIVIVPMNIDGEWNDVIVKFVKDKAAGGKKGAKKNIAITINVAPTFLGEITAAINFKGTSDCSLRMTFDNDQTFSWFKANEQGFSDAFAKLGLNGLKIDMQKSNRHRVTARTEAVKSADTAIDIVI